MVSTRAPRPHEGGRPWRLRRVARRGAVRAYIRSGNVVFEAAGTDEATLHSDIHDAGEAALGSDVTVMVRTREETDAVVADAHPASRKAMASSGT